MISLQGSGLINTQEVGREFLDSRIRELGTITGRGFPGRHIWKQGIIKKQEEVNIGTQVGGSGCAIRGGGGTLKTSKTTSRRRSQDQEAEEEDKFSGSPHKSSVAEGRKNKNNNNK